MIKIKYTANAMRLNHPETTPHPLRLWKNCLHKTGLWYQKGWGPLGKSDACISYIVFNMDNFFLKFIYGKRTNNPKK